MVTSTWSVVTIVISAISIPLLPYLWYTYHTLRKHFLISARFPHVSIFASICMFICSLCVAFALLLIDIFNINGATYHEYLSFLALQTIGNITAFTFCATIIWRTLLIYDAWEMEKYTLKNKNNIILSPDFIQTTTYKMYKICGSFFTVYHRRLIPTIAIIFIILVIIVSICSPLSSTNNSTAIIPMFITLLSWLIIVFIGIIVIIKAKNVKDSVFCIHETYLMIFMIFIQLIFVSLPNVFEFIIGYFIDTILTLFCSYLVIIVPLLMIYKHEGSLIHSKILKPRLSHSKQISNNKTTLSHSNLHNNVNEYLNNDVSSYNELAEFLTKCFALENLLFYAKVLVFRQVLINTLNTQKIETNNSDNEIEIIMDKTEINIEKTEEIFDKWCPKHLRKTVYAVKFSYLNGLYDSCSPTENMNIDNIAQSIYYQYIASTAINEVNISSYNKYKLINFFTSKQDHNTEQYLRIFNGAIEEIYGVLNSVYQFQYKSVKKMAE